jgi:SAM-dependent methyltransferase
MWSAKDLDQKLHVLSRWENFRSHAEWHAFVMAQIRPLNLDTNITFRYLEVGVGVGAFSREIIHTFPHVTGHGFDLVPRAIEVAAVVLPRDKVEVTVGDMVDIHEPSHSFDPVLVPGALCF